MQSGQVALIRDLTGVTGNNALTHSIVLGTPYGNAFGMVKLNDPSDAGLLLAAGQQGRVFRIDATTGTAPIAEVPGTPYVNETPRPGTAPGPNQHDTRPYPPSRGAALVEDVNHGKHLFGLPDGGAAYSPTTGGLTAVAFRYSGVHLVDRRAGVGILDMFKDDLDGDPAGWPDPLEAPWFWAFPQPGAGQEANLLAGVAKRQSAPGILAGYGNACAWADLDGNQTRDLVIGTHGGRVLWWANGSTSSTPSLGSGPSGELAIPTASPHAMLHGWKGDLGAQIIGMAVGDLDDDGDDEIIVGTGLAALLDSPTMPENFSLGGSIVVLNKAAGGELVRQASIQMPFGVYGLLTFSINAGPINDDYIVAGTAGGQIYVFHYDHNRPANPLDARFVLVYKSPSLSPMIGAYNSIQASSPPAADS